MRKNIIILLLSLSAIAMADDEFLRTVEKANSVSKHEGLYILNRYQSDNPKFAPVYYHLGVLCEATTEDEHPLKDYAELSEALYRTRLYYGNCIHYAKDQSVKPAYYEGIEYKGKKLTYEHIEKDLKHRIKKVKETEEYLKRLYTAYCTLSERYDDCRHLYTEFMNTYSREKNAHLYLNQADLQLLTTLATQADSLKTDISELKKAMSMLPVKGYQPQFRFEQVNLYRLDGLSDTDIMQNEVVLWDYASWAKKFIEQQTCTYSAYYAQIDTEKKALENCRISAETGKTTDHKTDYVLLNKIDRLDYGSFMRVWMELKTTTALIWQASQAPLLTSADSLTDAVKAEMLQHIYLQYNALKQADQLRQSLTKSVTDDAVRRYAVLLKQWETDDKQKVISSAEQDLQSAREAYGACCQNAYQRLSPSTVAFERYVNDITGEVITADSINYEPEGSVIDILPIGKNYMVVESAQRVVIADKQGETVSETRYDTTRTIKAAIKLTNNNIALITDNEFIFVDSNGKKK